MSSHYDIVVAGGGMVGGTFACAIGGSALKVAVLERQPPTPVAASDLRVSAITPASRRLFEALDIWPAIAAQPMGRVEAMEVWDQAQLRFDAADIGEPALAYIIDNAVLLAAINARLARYTNVHVVAPAVLADITLGDSARLALGDGRELAAKLLVGADGADSLVRQRAGIALRRIDLKQTALVATVRCQQPHANTAYQHFMSDGTLAFLPLAEPQLCSIVWSANTERAQMLAALDDVAFGAELTRASGGRLGTVVPLSPRPGFALALTHAVDYVRPGLALLGDAAHTVHPLAGQGVNLGLLDAAALAQVLLDVNVSGKNIGAHHLLRRYERWRKGDNWAMLAVTGGFRYAFGNALPGVRELRNLGLAATSRLSPVKNFFMRRACGLDGDLPQLAQRRSPGT